MTDTDRLRIFSYVNADKAPVYRGVMRAFMQARESFRLNLRPSEVLEALRVSPRAEPLDLPGVEAALGQLKEWGNLHAHPDTADVATAEEFYRPRFVFQLSREGEAAERAISFYEDTIRRPGELQATALSDIRNHLAELAELVAAEAPDPGRSHLILRALWERFDELTTRAQSFMASLQRGIDLHGLELQAFLHYKEKLLEYLERFIFELVLATADIADVLSRIEGPKLDLLLRLAADREFVDRLTSTEQELAQEEARWRARWAGLHAWFIGSPGKPSQAEVLRARARSAIPALLSAIASIHERRVTKSDRALDFKVLARWFAEAPTDAEAHRLFRATFGLTPSRHLSIDSESLEQREATPVSAQTSWLEAPPLQISPRLRATGRHERRGRLHAVVDRTEARAELAKIEALEAAQLQAAQHRLATGKRTRLSELGTLASSEFSLLLDLLGDALTLAVRPGEPVETISTDGTLQVLLELTGDGVEAVIATSEGELRGPDHYITIRSLAAEAPTEALAQ